MFMSDGFHLSGKGAAMDELSVAVIIGMGSIKHIF